MLLIGLNRPEKRNAADFALLHELAAAYTGLERDDPVGVGLVYADGEHFTAGLDLADVGPSLASGTIDFRSRGRDRPVAGLAGPERTKPVVVAVHGTCLTLGIELILAADVAVAADSSSFGQIEVRAASCRSAARPLRFPPAVGWGNAMRWMLTGDRSTPRRRCGSAWCRRSCPTAPSSRRPLAIAERIAAQAPLAVQAVLRSARAARRAAEAPVLAGLQPELAALAAYRRRGGAA